TNFVPTSQASIEQYFTGFVQQSASMPKLSLIFLLVTTWMLLSTVRNMFNVIWSEHTDKKALSTRLFQIFIALTALLIIPASIFVSTFILSVANYFSIIIWQPFFVILPLSVNAFIFFIINMVMPQHYVPWKDAAFGGIVTSVLFELS